MRHLVGLFVTLLSVISFGRIVSAQTMDGGTVAMHASAEPPSDPAATSSPIASDGTIVDYQAFQACLDACAEPLNQCGVPPLVLRQCLDMEPACQPFQPVIAHVIDQLVAQRPACPVAPAADTGSSPAPVAQAAAPVEQAAAPAAHPHRRHVTASGAPGTVRPSNRHTPPPWQPQPNDSGQPDAASSAAPGSVDPATGLANPDLTGAGHPHNGDRLTAREICDIEHGYWQQDYMIPSEDGTSWTHVSLCFTPADVALFRGLQNLGRRLRRVERVLGLADNGDASSSGPPSSSSPPPPAENALQHEIQNRVAMDDAQNANLNAQSRRIDELDRRRSSNSLAHGLYGYVWGGLGFTPIRPGASLPVSVGLEFGWRLRLSHLFLTYAGLGFGCSCVDAGSGLRAASLYRVGIMLQATPQVAFSLGGFGTQRFDSRLVSSYSIFGAELEVLFYFLSHGWSPNLGIALVGGVGLRSLESNGQERTDVGPSGAILLRFGFSYNGS